MNTAIIHSYSTPAQMPTLGGCCYYVTFIDDHSRYAWIFPMKKKSEVLSHFQRLKGQVEKETGRCLRSDGGKEYFSYLRSKGLRREFSCRHTPEQNGVSETKNRQIIEVARAIMREKHMPDLYWAKAVSRYYTRAWRRAGPRGSWTKEKGRRNSASEWSLAQEEKE